MDLIANNQATDLFGSERGGQSVAGIVGNIFQTFGGDDVYPSIEEKAAHLLYFMVKITRMLMATNALVLLHLCGF